MTLKTVLAFGVALCAAACASGALELASPFADGMVMQRGREVPVWGNATAGDRITVTFAGNTVEACAAADGRWKAELPAMEASKEGRTLTVRAAGSVSESRSIADVLVGEVWYVSGQSNAECPLWYNAKDGNNPRFRDRHGALVGQMTYRPYVRMCYASNYRTSEKPRERAAYPVKWESFSPDTLLTGHGFSAIGVYYALELYAALDVPIGIVGSYWGGTRIEPWIPAEGFESIGVDPATDEVSQRSKDGKARGDNQLPSRLWNEMVNPFAPMAMRGMIWYQGCSNSSESPERYTRMMHALYNGWSRKFNNPGMKLYYVQLAPWGGGGHPEFQQAQARFEEEQPNAAMAVINDLGNLTDIHPCDKEPVARRLVVHALKRDYGFDAIEDSSPKLRSWRIEGDRFVMEFDHAKSFYIYNMKYCSKENGFEICGADGVWKPGRIHNFVVDPTYGRMYGGIQGGNILEVSADGVSEPKKLRYLYSRPWYGSVYNEVCLPLGSFKIDGDSK
jgi:sialate O-acetylesterase